MMEQVTVLFDGLLDRGRMAIPLPESCSYDKYVNGAGCLAKATDPVSKSVASVAISKCPGSTVPYVSLSLEGPWTPFMLRPCTANTDCSDPSVHAAGVPDLACEEVTNYVWSFLEKDIGFYRRTDLARASDPITNLNGEAYSVYLARKRLHELWGLPAASSSASDQRLGFCIPGGVTRDVYTASAWKNMTSPVAAKATSNLQYKKCAAHDCYITNIGDNKCDVHCNNADCAYDGGDCGGMPANRVAPDRVAADMLENPELTLRYDDVAPEYRADSMFYGHCNGVGYAFSDYMTGQKRCNCPSNFPSGVDIKGYFLNTSLVNPNYNPQYPTSGYNSPYFIGPLCENINVTALPTAWNYYTNNYCRQVSSGSYTPLPFYEQPGQGCFPLESSYAQLGSIFSSWNGINSAGENMLSADRKNGRRFPVPRSDMQRPGTPTSAKYVAGLGCSGEISMHINNNMHLAMQSPLLQQGAVFLSNFLRSADNLGFSALSSSAVKLTDAQFEIRRQVHHMAPWVYQYFEMNGLTMNRRYGSQTNGFGDLPSNNFLVSAEEPSGLPSNASLVTSGWGNDFRMNPMPDCNFDTATLSGTGGARGRTCRASYNGMDTLLASNPDVKVLGAHLDIRQDICAYAPIDSFGTKLLAAEAADALPSMAIYLEGAVTALMKGGMGLPCTTNADCTGQPDGIRSCVDFDEDIIGGIDGLLPPKFKNLFAMFSAGRFGVNNKPCTDVWEFKRGLRRIIQKAFGRVPDGGNGLKFCMFDLAGVRDRWNGWSEQAYTECPTVALSSYESRRVCLSLPPYSTNNSATHPASIRGLGGFTLGANMQLATTATETMYSGPNFMPSQNPNPSTPLPTPSPSASPLPVVQTFVLTINTNSTPSAADLETLKAELTTMLGATSVTLTLVAGSSNQITMQVTSPPNSPPLTAASVQDAMVENGMDASVTAVTNDNGKKASGFPLGAIIGIAAGGALLLLAGAFLMYKALSGSKRSPVKSVSVKNPVSSLPM
jgi:hypothetical protein